MLRVIAALLAGLLLCAQTPMLPGFPPGTFQNRAALDATPASGPSYVFAGTDSTTAGATVFTSTTIDLGASTADRYVIVAASDQNAVTITSVTVNGVTIAQDCVDNGNGSHIFSGLVGTAGGAGVGTIVINYVGAGFTARAISVFVGRGMANTAGASTTASTPSAATSLSISVTAGDFMAGVNTFSTSYAGSTQAPTGTSSVPVGGINQTAPYWNTITSTNASFSITFGFSLFCAATYH